MTRAPSPMPPTPADASARSVLSRALLAVLDLAVPLTCGCCGAPGQRWCPTCRHAVRAAPEVFGVVAGATAPHRPTTWAARDYEGALAQAIVAYKDGDRRDLLGELHLQLARSLRVAVEAFEDDLRPIAVVPVPSSSAAVRRRGDAPVEVLARLAARRVAADLGPGSLSWVPVLRVRRRVEDQSHLGARARVDNLDGAFSLRAGVSSTRQARRLSGRACVVLDDVTTTGASLAEAARALGELGVSRVHGAVIAATRRRNPDVQPALPLLRHVV